MRSDTQPSFIVSLVARFPLLSMLLLLLLIAAATVPAVVRRPLTNNDFSSLLISDHASAATVNGDRTIEQLRDFWRILPTTTPGRRLQTTSDLGADGGVRTEISRMLNIFYRYSSGTTAITEELVVKVRLASAPGTCMQPTRA